MFTDCMIDHVINCPYAKECVHDGGIYVECTYKQRRRHGVDCYADLISMADPRSEMCYWNKEKTNKNIKKEENGDIY